MTPYETALRCAEICRKRMAKCLEEAERNSRAGNHVVAGTYQGRLWALQLAAEEIEAFAATLRGDTGKEPESWICGCGWVNGCNLDKCAACGRTVTEGSGIPNKETTPSASGAGDQRGAVARRAGEGSCVLETPDKVEHEQPAPHQQPPQGANAPPSTGTGDKPQAPAAAVKHNCGLRGYNPAIDPPCPACVLAFRTADNPTADSPGSKTANAYRNLQPSEEALRLAGEGK